MASQAIPDGTVVREVRIKDFLVGDMTKSVYDPDGNGKIDYNELENVGQRLFVSTTEPSNPNVNDIWIQI